MLVCYRNVLECVVKKLTVERSVKAEPVDFELVCDRGEMVLLLDRRIDRHVDRQMDKQSHIQMDKHNNRRHRQTDRQMDKQADRQTEK